MDKITRNELELYEGGDNPTMESVALEVSEDLWYHQAQDALIQDCKKIQAEDDHYDLEEVYFDLTVEEGDGWPAWTDDYFGIDDRWWDE